MKKKKIKTSPSQGFSILLGGSLFEAASQLAFKLMEEWGWLNALNTNASRLGSERINSPGKITYVFYGFVLLKITYVIRIEYEFPDENKTLATLAKSARVEICGPEDHAPSGSKAPELRIYRVSVENGRVALKDGEVIK